MAFSVVMPALEMAQETGKLVAWRKKEGDNVVKGEPLLEIETDKAVLEVEAPADGILAGVKAQAGAVVQVGKTIAWIVRPGETTPTDLPFDENPLSQTVVERSSHSSVPKPVEDQGGIKISPKARRLAKEQGVDLARVKGSGPGGEILASDIAAASQGSSPTPASDVQTLSSVARLMAERTTRSWTTVPHFFVSRDVNAGALVRYHKDIRSTVEQSAGVRPTHSDLLVALVARALEKHPRVNASWLDGKIRLNTEVNIGLAMAVEDGVVAGVIRGANKISLAEIARQRHELADRARSNRLRPNDIADITFTISNLGMYNVDSFSAIITPPQAAILAAGRITDRVVALSGEAVVQPMLTLTLSSDHRVIDGARAALFLNDVVETLREPENWLR